MPRIRNELIKLRPVSATDTGPLDVTVGGGVVCPEGSPSILLEMSEAFAYFAADPITYIGVMDFWVHNLTACYAYFTWEMKLWDGAAGDTCPVVAPERQEISRFLGERSAEKVMTIDMLRGNELAMVSGSFEIPESMEGEKTICLSLWGNYSKKALIAELLDDGGYERNIPWV